jgi:hypothetical protein
MPYRSVDSVSVADTVERLCLRVEHRFPDSGLGKVCRELDAIAERTKQRAEWIRRPILSLRLAAGVLVLLIVAGLGVTLASLRTPNEPFGVVQFIQVLESGINDAVLIGAAIFFLLTMEARIKRRRALAALHELRSIAHVIDMHQLTKDPEYVLGCDKPMGALPRRTMTRFELSRYLDYCAEALSLTAKVAALYVQDFPDDEALRAVNEI